LSETATGKVVQNYIQDLFVPTNEIYNGSVVKIYNATSSLVSTSVYTKIYYTRLYIGLKTVYYSI
jgi:hypothetical protein